MHTLIQTHIQPGSTVNTDEFPGYWDVGMLGYRHNTVNHSKGEYARPTGAGVNSIEGFWA